MAAMVATPARPVVDVAPADLERRRCVVRQVLATRTVRRAVDDCRRLGQAAPRRAARSRRAERGAPCAQRQTAVYGSKRAPEPLVADNESWAEQLDGAARAEHPAHSWAQDLGAGVQEAIERVAGQLAEGGSPGRQRSQTMAVLRRVQRALAPARRDIERVASPHVVAMASRTDVPLLYVLAEAAGAPDAAELAVGFAVGFEPVDDIPPSGWWTPEVRTATEAPLAGRDHEAWVDALEGRIRREAGDPSAASERDAVWRKTQEEVARGLMRGPFTRDEMDAAYGRGRWRPMQRFGVWQRGKLRACDNARSSGHNAATTTFERMVCENADFPARVAIAFQEVAEALGVQMWEMRAGTEDLSDAYRHVPTCAPQYTVVGVWDAAACAVRYFTLPGFNFGLKAAVPQFNRYAEAVAHVANVLLGVVCVHFFDDFCVAEPVESAASGQRALRELQAMLGAPFSKEKSCEPAAVLVFLGVETDLTEAATAGVVRMRVRTDRVQHLTQVIEEVIEGGVMPHSVAASLAGRLQFTLSWAFGRLGRAALQPLHADMAESGRARYSATRGSAPALTRGQVAALRFFASLLPELPPHEVRLRSVRERPVLVLSDARWEEEPAAGEVPYDEPGAVGFLVAVPRPGTPSAGPGPAPGAGLAFLAQYYDLYHGSAEVPPDMMEGFVWRRQQIGQMEILAGVVPYMSMPDVLRGRDVLHWIDNTSAKAALVHGYSGAPDSSRLVHLLQAWNVGLRARTWYEYVRSKANPSDEPSRVDLSRQEWEVLSEPRLTSSPVPVVFPQVDNWHDPAGWARQASWQAAAAPRR